MEDVERGETMRGNSPEQNTSQEDPQDNPSEEKREKKKYNKPVTASTKARRSATKGVGVPDKVTSKDRMRLFARYYLDGLPQGEAYIAAGYSCKEEHSSSNASKLLKRPFVQAEVERLLRIKEMNIQHYREVDDDEKDILVADKLEIEAILTQMIRDPDTSSSARIDAIKELSKIRGYHKEENSKMTTAEIAEELKNTLGLDG